MATSLCLRKWTNLLLNPRNNEWFHVQWGDLLIHSWFKDPQFIHTDNLFACQWDSKFWFLITKNTIFLLLFFFQSSRNWICNCIKRLGNWIPETQRGYFKSSANRSWTVHLWQPNSQPWASPHHGSQKQQLQNTWNDDGAMMWPFALWGRHSMLWWSWAPIDSNLPHHHRRPFFCGRLWEKKRNKPCLLPPPEHTAREPTARTTGGFQMLAEKLESL